MIAVILYGHLAKQFGKRHMLAVNTPAEAVRAMCANYKQFRQAIMLHNQMAYRVLAGNEDRADEEGLRLPCGKAKTIKIIPVIAGSGGIGKILLGAALLGASFMLPGTAFGLTEFGLFATNALSSIGFSLLLGGVSSLLFSPPKPQKGASERPENRPSYNFNGPINTTQQGGAVPLCYGGPIRVGSQVISAGTETVNL